MSRIHSLSVLLICLISFSLSPEAQNIKIIPDSGIDTTELKSLVKSITRDLSTDREKMIALWAYITRNPFYHWCEAREGHAAAIEYGVIRDPIKAFNVYGTVICYQVADMLANMAMEAGIPARTRGFPGRHKVMEAYYDDSWHLFDAQYDCQAYYLKKDGTTIASLDEVKRDPVSFIRNPAHPSDPFFAFDKFMGTFWPWESREWVIENWFECLPHDTLLYYHPLDCQGHVINISLRRGEKLIRYWTNEGKWFCTPDMFRVWNRDRTQRWVSLGPHDPRDPQNTYANGWLVYKSDWEAGEINFLDGLYSGKNYRFSRGKVQPDEAGKAHVCFHIRSPYLLAGHPNRLEVDGDSRGGALFSAVFYRKSAAEKARLYISTDRGNNWSKAWEDDQTGEHKVEIDLTPFVEGHYEYLIKVELEAARAGDVSFGRLELRNCLFYSPVTLPSLHNGTNSFTVTLSEPSETLCINPDFTTPECLDSGFFSMENLEYSTSFTTRLSPPAGQTGSAVYEVDPPGEGRIYWMSVHGSFSHEPGSGGNDSFRIYCAADKPENWRLLWETTAEELDRGWMSADGKKRFGEHWRYDKTVEVFPDKPCRKYYVKYEISRVRRASLNDLKIYAHYEPERLVSPPRPDDIVITHAWNEDGNPRKHKETLRSKKHTYTVSVSEGQIKNESITIEVKNSRR